MEGVLGRAGKALRTAAARVSPCSDATASTATECSSAGGQARSSVSKRWRRSSSSTLLTERDDHALPSGARNPVRVRHSRKTVLPVGRNTRLFRRKISLGPAARRAYRSQRTDGAGYGERTFIAIRDWFVGSRPMFTVSSDSPRSDAPWRRGWDSNPRYACTHNGFRDRRLRPLGHLSVRDARYKPAARVLQSLKYVDSRQRGTITPLLRQQACPAVTVVLARPFVRQEYETCSQSSAPAENSIA